MVFVLRLIVTALVALHVLLIADALDAAGMLGIGLIAVTMLVAASVIGVLAYRGTVRNGARAATLCAILDAFALITIARLSVDIDPASSIVWVFVLWVPFSLAARFPAMLVLAQTMLVALFVFAATLVAMGPLSQMDRGWSTVAVPPLIVAFTGILVVLAARGQRRGELQMNRDLSDERDRALRLREADDVKNTFLAAVSHELRTPLTSILGFSVTMLDRPDLETGQRERMLRTVVAEAEHLEDILSNLLDLDRLTRGKSTLVPAAIDPATLIRDAVAQVERRSERTIALDLETDLLVWIDASKAERIVENLVGNAAKYTPGDAQITVKMRGESGGITICVDDDGPGIPDALRETIFDPFRRGDDTGVPGTGIGLSLVDAFSRMHGGRAWVEQRPEGGCSFQVFLPSQVVSAPHAHDVNVAEQPSIDIAAESATTAHAGT